MNVSLKSDAVVSAELLSYDETRRVIAGHIPALDGLRGIAIILVLVDHLVWAPVIPKGYLAVFIGITRCGWIGVQLFFVLSGFLITGILLDSKTAENYFSSFYIRRALRILPLSYAVVFIAFVLVPLLGKWGVPYLPVNFSKVQLWYWFYLGNMAPLWNQGVEYFSHFWSLAVEEQFYLVWPWVVYATSRRALARICLVMCIVAPVIRIVLLHRGVERMHIYFLTPSNLDALALGALAALIVRNRDWLERLAPRLTYFIYPTLAIFCCLGAVDATFGVMDGPAYFYGVLPIAISFTAVLLFAVLTSGLDLPLQRFLNARWLRVYGKYSYGIYVLHMPLAKFYGTVLIPRLFVYIHHSRLGILVHHPNMLLSSLLLLVALLVSVGLALFFLGLAKLSWLVLEGPANSLKTHFKPHWRTQAEASAKV